MISNRRFCELQPRISFDDPLEQGRLSRTWNSAEASNWESPHLFAPRRVLNQYQHEKPNLV